MKRFIAPLFICALGFCLTPDFVDRTSDTAALGRGNTGYARSNSIYGLSWNPASIANQTKSSLGITYYQKLEAINHLSLDGTALLQHTPIAISYIQEEIPDIPKTIDRAGEPYKESSFTDASRCFAFGSGLLMGNGLSLGASFKNYTRTIDRYSAQGYGVDLGLMQRLNKTLTAGLVFKNLISDYSWSTGQTAQLERRIGVGLSAQDKLGDAPLSLDIDYTISPDDTTLNDWGLGAEWWLYKNLSLRSGYNSNKDITVGLGFNYYDFSTDFAYIIKNQDTHFENMFLFSSAFVFRIDPPQKQQTEPERATNAFTPEAIQNVTTNQNLATLTLNPEINILQIAVLRPDQKIFYITPSNNQASFPFTAGEHTIYIQKKDETIVKQKIQLP